MFLLGSSNKEGSFVDETPGKSIKRKEQGLTLSYNFKIAPDEKEPSVAFMLIFFHEEKLYQLLVGQIR